MRRASRLRHDTACRDAVIQRFEYSYELAWKSLKRVLEAEAPSTPEIDALSLRDLIRRGAESGMIDDPDRWFAYREDRNVTSHIYDESKAISVYEGAIAFARSARELLRRLEARLS